MVRDGAQVSPGEINVHLQDTDGMTLLGSSDGTIREKTIHRLSRDIPTPAELVRNAGQCLAVKEPRRDQRS